MKHTRALPTVIPFKLEDYVSLPVVEEFRRCVDTANPRAVWIEKKIFK